MYEKLQKWKWQDGLLAAGLALITVGIGFNLRESLNDEKPEMVKAKISPTVTIETVKWVMIDVEGEVVNPGVYKLNKTDRIQEALIAAGGLSAEADREWVAKNINRAEMVSEGLKVYIPRKGDTLGAAVQISKETTGIVNINNADSEQLETLPGIGPAMAARIIDYRKNNGGFKDINELKMVSGIGDKMYEKIKDLVQI